MLSAEPKAESRSHSYFAVRELDICVRALDIALGNHALRAQPADYSLICRLLANEKTDDDYNV